MDIRTYITRPTVFPLQNKQAWEIVGNLEAIIRQLLAGLGAEYHIANAVLSLSSVLEPRTIVKRLQLVEQDPQ